MDEGVLYMFVDKPANINLPSTHVNAAANQLYLRNIYNAMVDLYNGSRVNVNTSQLDKTALKFLTDTHKLRNNLVTHHITKVFLLETKSYLLDTTGLLERLPRRRR